MKGIVWITAILLGLLILVLAPEWEVSAQSEFTSEAYGEPEPFSDYLEQQLPSLMDRYEIPGAAIALIKKGAPVWSGAFGLANAEACRPMTADAIFRVESLSKPVTAWGVMKLVERGLIRLDDPVQQYLESWTLPESEFNLKGVTIRRLLSNSAGMPQGTLGEEYPPHSKKPSLKKYLAREAHLIHEPGSKFHYSNPGFNLLELLVEEVCECDFNVFMEREVLIPLGMHNSGFNWNEDQASKVPMGYDLQGAPVSPYVYPYRASGGLFATVEDIARFVSEGIVSGSNRDTDVLSKQSIQIIQEPRVKTSGIFSFVADAYGFGHFIETLPNGSRALWHGGQGHGWMTHFHMVPETGDGIVILTNSQRSWPLMARVLKDWSQWQGFGPVQFGRITKAAIVLKIIIGLILLVAFWRAVQVVQGVKTGRRKLCTLPGLVSWGRMVEVILALAILGTLIWAVNKDYLFLSSIFPVGAVWLGWALLFLSLMQLVSALLPVIREREGFKVNH